jgi:hypothetical protein
MRTRQARRMHGALPNLRMLSTALDSLVVARQSGSYHSDRPGWVGGKCEKQYEQGRQIKIKRYDVGTTGKYGSY